MNTDMKTATNTAAPRLLIADDEPLLRRHLQALLTEFWPEAQTTLAEDGSAALALCQQQRFDIAFLDIQMPGLDGLQLLRELRRLPAPPLVVFSTAFNQHAVSAFELEAVDYLLKPLEEARLQQCITRLKQRLSLAQKPQADLLHLQQLLSQLMPPAATMHEAPTAPTAEPLRWIKASQRDTVHLLDIADIDFFLAEDKYTTVDSAGQQYLIRTSIATLEQQLDPQLYWRIHRGCIVQVKSILKVERDEFGHMTLVLKNNPTELAVSRAYQHLFRQH
ncbi:LytR/AlgR family response regulator transcription factor [Rheinheimera texasensis]|uniref:LytR/AlgR family response regulator transcription factor n=1 Tax=Rheinheimera texasensis TaxID=306205 RepID=UPI0006908CD1|nr:LytTR family DNA-binding domain-containing protein [Rheinheimera texasensis]